MPRSIEAKAEMSVGRACGFAMIAIITFMVGTIAQPSQSLAIGGVLTLLTCFILLLKANLAPRKPYKRTEVWLLLDKAERPQPTVAQQVIGRVMQEVFLRFALRAARLSLALLSASLLVRVLPRAF